MIRRYLEFGLIGVCGGLLGTPTGAVFGYLISALIFGAFGALGHDAMAAFLHLYVAFPVSVLFAAPTGTIMAGMLWPDPSLKPRRIDLFSVGFCSAALCSMALWIFVAVVLR